MSSVLLASILLATFLLASLCHPLPLSAPQGMLMEDKTRLGSTPPSCHNRCNACSPCKAVQVPTLPGTGPGLGAGEGLDVRASYNMYSNYKPLGWKCQCGNRFFNP